MNTILFIILIYSSFFKTAGNFKILTTTKASVDTTRHEKFILSILNDYENSGQWMFIQLDSCDIKYPIIVHPSEIFKAFSETTKNLNRKLFVSLAFETLKHNETIFNCPSEDAVYEFKTTPIKGTKINKILYHELLKIDDAKLLKKYFNTDKSFNKKYDSILSEIVAVCYSKNIQIITGQNGQSSYKIYK